MNSLPTAAWLYVGVSVSAAAVIVATHLPATMPHPALFVALAAASSAASALKLKLPLGTSASNLSVSYTVDFASLILLGPDATMLVAALSAWTQSTVSISRRNPVFRTLFNIAALILTVRAAGFAFQTMGGQPGVFDIGLIKPLVSAALVYYLFNTWTVAIAIALSMRQPVWDVWQRNFLWTAPSYFVGAGAAGAAAAAWATGRGWFVPLAAAPVYLTFLSYRVYLERIEAEKRHRDEVLKLHEQTVLALEAARASEQRYALAADGSNDGLWDWDLAIDRLYVSDRWKLMLGRTADAAFDRIADWFACVHPEDKAELQATLDRHLAGESTHFEHEYRLAHQDRTYRWMLCRGVAVRDEEGRPSRMAGSQTDITERRLIQDELKYAALHDSLTGLANRALFSELLNRALARTRRSPADVFAVLFIDLDRFKLVNDSLGHMAGDKFLRLLGDRLLHHLRPGDSLSRLGGDEFAILLEDLPDSKFASTVADRLQEALAAPFDIDGREIYASASIGIAFGTDQYQTSDELLRDADTAMYGAKKLGRSQNLTFHPSMHTSALNRLTVETQLRRALERQEFLLHYQPIMDLETGDISGFEALVRWKRADGVMQPAEFIPIAEETGLITPLTHWVLREASIQIGEWQRQFDMPITVSVNVSSRLFERATFVEEVREVLAVSGLIPGTLRLEITESLLLSDSRVVAEQLVQLRAIPVQLYLDDFGTGFSSLSYLHRYHVDALKIDQTFIRRIGGSNLDSPIVGSIVNLARQLGIGVIAEGVETQQQVNHLTALSCPHAQGFLFSRPLGASDAFAFISAQNADDLQLGDPRRASALQTTETA